MSQVSSRVVVSISRLPCTKLWSLARHDDVEWKREDAVSARQLCTAVAARPNPSGSSRPQPGARCGKCPRTPRACPRSSRRRLPRARATFRASDLPSASRPSRAPAYSPRLNEEGSSRNQKNSAQFSSPSCQGQTGTEYSCLRQRSLPTCIARRLLTTDARAVLLALLLVPLPGRAVNKTHATSGIFHALPRNSMETLLPSGQVPCTRRALCCYNDISTPAASTQLRVQKNRALVSQSCSGMFRTNQANNALQTTSSSACSNNSASRSRYQMAELRGGSDRLDRRCGYPRRVATDATGDAKAASAFAVVAGSARGACLFACLRCVSR